MLLAPFVVTAVLLNGAEASSSSNHEVNGSVGATDVCQQIANSISSESQVFFPGSQTYTNDLAHWSTASIQNSTCSVEPANVKDARAIMRILGSTKTAFAVKSGGHATNVGFSSTTGVTIALARFSGIQYDAQSNTVTVGAGLFWEDVYAALEPHNVNVLGGRVPGIGVGGFALGGGYSWKANQFGLTLDSVTQFELVKPNGQVCNVTHESDPELFFGLRGGFNNFGIVTRFTLETHPQGQVWGGPIHYAPDKIPAIKTATAKFVAEVRDPKANIQTSFAGVAELGTVISSVNVFYDGPTPPPGIFDDFLNIQNTSANVSTRSFLSLVNSLASSVVNKRVALHTVSISDYPESIIESIYEEAQAMNTQITINGTGFAFSVEPFQPGVYNHSKSESAYPPNSARKAHLLPLAMSNLWPADRPDLDQTFQDALRSSAQNILNAAVKDGVGLQNGAIYPNYAIAGTKLEMLYGENVERLRALKKKVDPGNVMGLAGGWKF